MDVLKYKRADWEKIITDACKLRGYSDKTVKNYIFHVGRFLESGKSVEDYLVWMVDNVYRDESIRLAGFAIKFYLSCIGIDDYIEFPNVKREKKLPVVLSKKEIESMIKTTHNIKFRLMIMLGYGCGLRVSEIVSIKWSDVDFTRNVLHIKNAKGKKDRVVMLSPKIKKILRSIDDNNEYILTTQRKTKYSTRSVQEIVSKLANLAGIRKKVSPHTLRHSFATHLLEQGIDIHYIKELLGHASVSTTQIYTKVSARKILLIKSPLD